MGNLHLLDLSGQIAWFRWWSSLVHWAECPWYDANLPKYYYSYSTKCSVYVGISVFVNISKDAVSVFESSIGFVGGSCKSAHDSGQHNIYNLYESSKKQKLNNK